MGKRKSFLSRFRGFSSSIEGLRNAYLRIWSGTLKIRLLMTPRWCRWGCDDCRPLHNFCESFSRFCTFHFLCKFSWNLNLSLRSIFPLFLFAFSFFVLFFYQLPKVLMVLVGSFVTHQSHHFALISTSCPHLVNSFRTSGCFPVDSRASITAKCPRNSKSLAFFFDTIHAIWNWTRNQIREKKSIKKRSIIAKYFGEKPFRHSRVLANQ